MSFHGALLYVEEARPIDGDPFHDVPHHGSPAIDSVLVRRSALARVGGFDPALRVQADWDFCLRLAASGARFRSVPGNFALVRQRSDSVSACRTDELPAAAVAVLERHLRGHSRCPACAPAEAVLRSFQRVVDRQRVAALLAEAKWLARRLGLTGRPARWIGTFLAVARRPRLSGIVLAALAARWRSAERGAAARRPDADRRVSE